MRLSHVGWNLCGLTLPLGVAAVTVPHLITSLGSERFGLLALAWGLIGYAGAMDLGMGRALTQMVARLKGENNVRSIADVLATASRITLITGLIGTALIASAAFMGAYYLVHAASVPAVELRYSMLLLAVALPAQAMSATYRGMNEAFLNFRGINVLRAMLGVLNFAGPWCVSLLTVQMPWLIGTLVASRLAALLIYRHLAHKILRQEFAELGKGTYSPTIARNLFSFGGWVTVSSIVSPMLVQSDRFVIAATLSASIVSIYVLPYEMVVQCLVLVGAVSSVMFPGLARLMRENPNGWQAYFRVWLLRVVGLMAIVATLMAVLLPIILPMWIKNAYHPVSADIGRVLCLGVFANAIGSMFYALLHAKGRADFTAKLHVVELPLYILTLFVLISAFGVVGAAYAWVCRVIFDTCVLAWYAQKETKAISPTQAIA